jgi:hypothetical protein
MRYIYLLIVFLAASIPTAAAKPNLKLESVHKIWDQAPHCAFTDLTWWKGQFVCAFREGRAHVATDGKIRVLTSADGESWSSAASLSLDGFDLRDAGLSVTPDCRLMLIGGAAPRKNEKDRAPTGTFVSFSDDAHTWSKPQIVVEPGRWLWRVTWHDGKAYGVSYTSFRNGANDSHTALLESNDGLAFHELVPRLYDKESPTEATLRFDDDSTAYCLQRRDGTPPRKSAVFGISRPPYTDWKWHDLGMHVGGPNLLRLPSGEWLAAGRFFDGTKPSTKVALLDVKEPSIKPVLQLPSGGDTSYPGLVWHDGKLWMSYYSSHEGKAQIYIAKIDVD